MFDSERCHIMDVKCLLNVISCCLSAVCKCMWPVNKMIAVILFWHVFRHFNTTLKMKNTRREPNGISDQLWASWSELEARLPWEKSTGRKVVGHLIFAYPISNILPCSLRSSVCVYVHECVWESTSVIRVWLWNTGSCYPVSCLLGNNGCTILNKYILKDVGCVRERACLNMKSIFCLAEEFIHTTVCSGGGVTRTPTHTSIMKELKPDEERRGER